jgi:hypothetical protein
MLGGLLPAFGNGAGEAQTKLVKIGNMKDGRPFTFAGLWEGWKDPESGEWQRTRTIITGEPNPARQRRSIPVCR